MVRDDKLQVVKTLSESETASFNSYWGTKTTVTMPWGSQGSRVVLDVTRGHGGGRWFYWTNGYLQVVSIPARPVYRIADPEAFNRLLGLHR